MARTALFPEIEPFETGMMDTGGVHQVYWEQSGNPTGVPVVFLHGGPGGGAGQTHRRFYDPDHYRIVVFDQRGCGRSTPVGDLTDNTTPHLIADIEQLRQQLGIERWIVFGGSWGSTLALAYAETHPGRCMALVMRGIFLCRPQEIEWFLNGMGTLFPEHWREFVSALPEAEHGDLLTNFYRVLTDPDPAVHMPAARAWSIYEGRCATLLPDPDVVADFADDAKALSLARIEAHYFINDIFLPLGSLLDNIHVIRHIPTVMVQGRYDIVCPLITADTVAQAWPEADYRIIPDAGHMVLEPGILATLLEVMEDFKKLA
ncbi:MAG: prolyl aminopeptidase [Alphaproteobacteria bacterium]|jgi:proline iminopeptidase